MINKILAASTIGAPQPEVGMGATILMHSDRHAATIIEVEYFKTGPRAGQAKAVTVQRDTAQRVDSNGMSDAQTYVYLPNPNGATTRFTLRKGGRWEAYGFSLGIGYRDEHFDFSY